MVNGRPCSCVAEAARTLRREEINAASPLALCSFDTFELDRYPAEPEPELGGTPRDYMAKCWPTASGTPAALRRKAAA